LIASETGRFNFTLAGGNTPRTLYTLLGTDFRDKIPWDHVHLFWGDERYVPPDNVLSNYRLVRESLLERIKIPQENIHPMRTDFEDPTDAAKNYESVLKDHFSTPWPSLNLVLLGLGVDGHIASLFPSGPVLDERKRWVMPVASESQPRVRLTLTLPVLAHAEQIYFLVAGSDKARALRRTLTGVGNTPAAKLLAERPDAVFWTDDAAARQINPQRE
jgi:6-phosphogluconolactonase